MTASSRSAGLAWFIGLVSGLAAMSVALAYVAVPRPLVRPAGLLVSALYIALPVFAIYAAGSMRWRWQAAVAMIVAGVGVHVGLSYAAAAAGGQGLLAAVFGSLGQTGLLLWCVGLGALLAVSLKEKNLLIPVSLFLAAFDIFTVLTPVGPTQAILRVRPEVFESIAWKVPKVQQVATFGPVPATAHIGPADFLFMAMFFVALFRFGMKTRPTLLWLIPTLIVYMGFVFWVGPLPALVPVGLCVLSVNWGEFRLTLQEWASTALVAALGAGLILWGATRPKPPPVLLPGSDAPGIQEPSGSPSQAPPGSHP